MYYRFINTNQNHTYNKIKQVPCTSPTCTGKSHQINTINFLKQLMKCMSVWCRAGCFAPCPRQSPPAGTAPFTKERRPPPVPGFGSPGPPPAWAVPSPPRDAKEHPSPKFLFCGILPKLSKCFYLIFYFLIMPAKTICF